MKIIMHNLYTYYTIYKCLNGFTVHWKWWLMMMVDGGGDSSSSLADAAIVHKKTLTAQDKLICELLHASIRF